MPPSQKLPDGHRQATAIAEAVMLDRVRELLDRHYDAVFTADWVAAHAADASTEAGLAQSAAEQPAPESSTPTVPRAEPPRRHNAYRVGARVLEAHTA